MKVSRTCIGRAAMSAPYFSPNNMPRNHIASEDVRMVAIYTNGPFVDAEKLLLLELRTTFSLHVMLKTCGF